MHDTHGLTEPAAATPATMLSTYNKSVEWSHTPSNVILAWLAMSLPIILWDTGYVLLRPHSMAGGVLHSPVWKPYALYAEVDQVYGMKALEEHNGWTATQSWFNLIETAGYFIYLYCVCKHGRPPVEYRQEILEESTWDRMRAFGKNRTVNGRMAAYTVLLAYSTACLTFSKTVLYWLIEAFSGFDNIGQNDLQRLIFLWIMPNGAWLVIPLYMSYVLGKEILRGLDFAAGGEMKRK